MLLNRNRQYSIYIQPTVHTPSLWQAVFLLWMRPQETMRFLAAGSLWSSLIPCALALMALYGQLLTRAYLGVHITEWILIGGVAGLIVGWPARIAVLAIFSRWLRASPDLRRLALLYLWATLPLTLREILQLIYILSTGLLPGKPGLQGLWDEQQHVSTPSVMADLAAHGLSYVDLFVLWHLMLLVIMLKVGARATTVQATLSIVAYCALLFILGSGPK